MNKPHLGKLEKIEDLRTYWKNESQDFTPWLAEPENIQQLSGAIGLDLYVEARERAVGPFSADILCKDRTSGGWVVVENQLEPTDHKHLGQLLTYSAGLGAKLIVWIAEKFTDDHRAALDWLNEITGEGFGFFGVEIELWKIGDSLPAPKFKVLCMPNDWSRSVKVGVELSETKQRQVAFWTLFKEYMEARSRVRCQNPAAQHWMNHSIGRTGLHLSSIASTWDSESNRFGSGELRVELVLDDGNSKMYFTQWEALPMASVE